MPPVPAGQSDAWSEAARGGRGRAPAVPIPTWRGGAWGLVLALGGGALLRLWLLQRSHWMVEGDEAVIGLMAKHVLEGERPVFFAAQPYMGALQAYEAAGVYLLLGMSRVALKLVPLLAGLGFVATTWWLARRLLSPRAAAVAALVAAAPPVYVAANTLKALGPYTEVMAVGNLLLGLAAGLAWGAMSGPPVAFSLGLLAGFAFWLNPVSAYALATAGLLVVAGLRRRLVPLLPALGGGALLGGLPLWAENLATGFETFRYLARGIGGGREVAGLAEHLWSRSLPRVLGLWQPWGETPPALAWALGAALAGGLAALVAWGRRTHGWRPAPSDTPVAFGLVGGGIFLLSGFGETALNPWGFDAAGRYVVPLWAAVPLGMGALAELLWPRARGLAIGLVGLVLGAHLYGWVAAEPLKVFQSPYWERLPFSSEALAATLKERDLRHVWLNHWAGYPLMLDARAEIVAADYYDVFVGGGPNRFPRYLQAVEQARRSAYVLVTDEDEPKLERRLRAMGVAYFKARAGPYVVLEPLSRPVHPSEVVDSIGYEY